MSNKRIKFFIVLLCAAVAVIIGRLVQLQLVNDSYYQEQVNDLKQRYQDRKFLKTIRGSILDRHGRVLAEDIPAFTLDIEYTACCILDPNVQMAMLLRAAGGENASAAIEDAHKDIAEKLDSINAILDKCANFNTTRQQLLEMINDINSKIWRMRDYIAWKRNYPQFDSFEAGEFDPDKRILKAAAVDLVEMHKAYELIRLESNDDIFTAQLEFMNTSGIRVTPRAKRYYPYGSIAAQTIGYVGPEQKKELFVEDPLSSYLEGELSGNCGVEFVCEEILRGKRGQVVYDIDDKLKLRTETELGSDIHLTLDIELQRQIENYLENYTFNDPNLNDSGIGAVVIDVATGDILAMVSVPTFDLNRARYNDKLFTNPYRPLYNRAMQEHYPPGSVIKPLILIAGLEEGKINPEDIISCPNQKAPKGWPNCHIINYGHGHDDNWANNGRNAIKGSCNIYFPHLADMIEPENLQRWLFAFGYGRLVPLEESLGLESNRTMPQSSGYISSTSVRKVTDFNDIPELKGSDRRWFGIGQGNCRVTVLQAAAAMAAISRNGIYIAPRLFLGAERADSIYLNISPQTMAAVRDGMYAVVNESGGTARKEFSTADFGYDIKVYGKTGSTQAPEHAWFGGFAEDGRSHAVAVAVVVEGGQHGSSDAAPLARDIIKFCIDAGYIGNKKNIDNTAP
ncbi:MAG: penicillin-binding transpeptidase domain-containing protein [Phycisphaerae bacterium]|nr:penicillin-binding transpeptidase domain-containing protein [Phycisphaerae bacterium]